MMVDRDSLTLDRISPLFVGGRVWLQAGNTAFPCHGWTDEPLSVIGSMGTAIDSIRSGEEEEWDFYFFDGSYFVKLLPDTAEDGSVQVVRVVGLDDHDEDNPVIGVDVRVPLVDLQTAFAQAVRTLRDWADSTGSPELIAAVARTGSPLDGWGSDVG
ncbi:hypothetical protein [Frankia sp. AgB1.9]|uniref:hypothetical protein n=2 Tax=Frankia TaxID=1854 RepID=UPI001A5DB391|nr:hypothetical protein [Frankia sp. AgB1.9]MBL7619233.1 hypothetical protein [Frankia sp. AgB1.8]